jgi:hypothetical protein
MFQDLHLTTKRQHLMELVLRTKTHGGQKEHKTRHVKAKLENVHSPAKLK